MRSQESLRTPENLLDYRNSRYLAFFERNRDRPSDRLTDRPILDVVIEDRAFAKRTSESEKPPLMAIPKEDWIVLPSERELSITVGAHVDATNHIYWTSVCLADLPNNFIGIEDFELIRLATGLNATAILEAILAASTTAS